MYSAIRRIDLLSNYFLATVKGIFFTLLKRQTVLSCVVKTGGFYLVSFIESLHSRQCDSEPSDVLNKRFIMK